MKPPMRTPRRPDKDREPSDLDLEVEEIADLDPTSEAAGQVVGGGSGTPGTVERHRIHAQAC